MNLFARPVFLAICGILLAFGLSSCGGGEKPSPGPVSVEKLLNPNGPGGICTALASIGIATKPWRQNPAGAPGYYCQSDYVPVGLPHEVTTLQNLLVYSVNSASDPGKFDKVTIEGRYYRNISKQELKKQLTSAVAVLFKSLGAEPPEEVLRAVQSENAFQTSLLIGAVTVEKDCGPELPMNNQMCWVAVSISTAASSTASSKGEADEEGGCKDHIVSALKYPKDALKGDGKPSTSEEGRSYLFKGREGDLLLCQLQAGGSYVIKIAAKGQFPFREAARGRF